MSVNRVNISYKSLSDKDLGLKSSSIYTSLNGNTNFTFKATTLPALRTAIDDFLAKLNKSLLVHTSANISIKNIARETLVKNLRSVGEEVNLQANSDIVKLMSSGFVLSKKPEPVGILPKPINLKVVTGLNSGELLMSVDACPNCSSYCFYYGIVSESGEILKWEVEVSSKHKINVHGFKPGIRYAVKCAYKGTEAELVFSDILYIYAQ
jgi:hypothetical protein